MARPREFDQEKVLNDMTQVFWKRGFKGTSMASLVRKTGLNKGSLYTCFGKKEDIFKLALENYVRNASVEQDDEASPIGRLCQFYSFIISDADLPKERRLGCFVFNSCLEFGNSSARIRSFVLSLAEQREKFFQNLLEKARDKGEISAKVDTSKAGQRAFATAFAIRELSKFKPEKDFLCDLANSFLESIGTERRVS